MYAFQGHPWFKNVDWENLYQLEAAFLPEVNDELDTQNFEKFEEVEIFVQTLFLHVSLKHLELMDLQSEDQIQPSSRSGPCRKVNIASQH